MAVDYTVYTNWYNYMNNLLYQIQSMSEDSTSPYSSLYSGQVQSGLSFLDIFQSLSSGSTSQVQAPADMDAIFEEAARTYNVSVDLLKAVGKAESNFNASAVSSAGAQGVMQLMPATADYLGVEDPFDARSNIMGGAKYLSQMLERYDGDLELALAAYNAGSGNVAKYGGVPPFTETQNYIRKVKEYMGMDLTAGTSYTAQTGSASYGSSISGVDGESGLSVEMAQYMVEMMRLQMLSGVNSLTSSLGDTDDTGSYW